MAKYTFIRNNPTDPNRKAVEQVDNTLSLYGCFAFCDDEVLDRLKVFVASKQESVTFEFDGETVEIRRE